MAITRPSSLLKPFAAEGGKNAIPVDSQIGVGNSGGASYTDGFPPLTRTPIAAGGIPPAGLDMNGVLYDATRHIQWTNAGGQARFDAALAAAIGGYPVGVVLQSDDGLSAYLNIVAANTDNFNTTPASIGVSWLPYAGDALKRGIIPGATFAEVDALAADQGPIIVTDMGCMPWVWTNTAYFTGYRNPLCATIPQHFAATARAWEMPVTGGVWSESDPKQRRLIAWFREQGLTVASGSWAKGWGRIADLGGGDWKAPDLQDIFLRMAGTDADTANVAGPGTYKIDQLQNIKGTFPANRDLLPAGRQSGALGMDSGNYPNTPGIALFGTCTGQLNFNAAFSARTGVETAPAHTRVLPVILV